MQIFEGAAGRPCIVRAATQDVRVCRICEGTMRFEAESSGGAWGRNTKRSSNSVTGTKLSRCGAKSIILPAMPLTRSVRSTLGLISLSSDRPLQTVMVSLITFWAAV